MCFSGRHAKRMAPRVGPVVLLGSRRGERVDGHGELSVLEAAAELSVMSGEEAERGSHGREWAKQYDMRLPFFLVRVCLGTLLLDSLLVAVLVFHCLSMISLAFLRFYAGFAFPCAFTRFLLLFYIYCLFSALYWL